MQLAYATVRTPVGRALVVATPRGVCAIQLGHRADGLLRHLKKAQPDIRLRRGGRLVRAAVRALHAYLHGKAVKVPLDVHGTPFQMAVWAALRGIPRGETRTYAQVARGVGRPTAARAVARACAANPVAILIPCHRVVRSDGQVGGYRWGEPRKRALLRYEQSAT
ncbi:MAG: methylated-DNA--[protein]-cysteine S-methyltransferase [bacterium]